MISRKRMVAIAGVVVLVAGWWLASGSDAPVRHTAPVSRGDIEEVVLASGILTPIRQVSVGAQVNGQLKSLKVRLGDRVRKGELLAEIDPVLQQNELRRAEAALKNVQAQRAAHVAQWRQHDQALRREQALRVDDANAPADLELAQSQVDVTSANIDALDAQIRQSRVTVESARANLAYTRIVAPIDGQVIAVVTQEGQTVVSAQAAPTILVLADLDRMLVKARISEADVVRVRAGQDAWFSILGAPQRRFNAPLRSVEPAPPAALAAQDTIQSIAGTQAIYYNGLLEVANEDRTLKPSMTAQVSIVLGRVTNALKVPAAAVSGPDSDGKYTVAIDPGQGLPIQRREVTIGLSDHVSVQIVSGVNAGEQVVLGPDASANQQASAS